MICDVARCGDKRSTVGQMTAHLIADHESSPSVALIHARRIAGLETRQPELADLSGTVDNYSVAPTPRILSTRQTTPELTGRAKELSEKIEASRCKFCVRVAPEKCRLHGGDSVENKRAYNRALMREKRSHKANPDGCLTCRALAPEKCKRHGGPSHSTSYRGRGRVAPMSQ